MTRITNGDKDYLAVKNFWTQYLIGIKDIKGVLTVALLGISEDDKKEDNYVTKTALTGLLKYFSINDSHV
jgi:hypothetical protein